MLCTLQMERLCRPKLLMASHLKMTLYSTLIHPFLASQAECDLGRVQSETSLHTNQN